MTTKRLAGRVAIVTGAGRGIGRAIALRYSQEGAAVALAARTPAQINEAAAEIESNGGRALAIQCDVSSESDVDRLVDATVRQFGKIDILANNAAVNLPPTDLTEVDLSVWRNVIDVNLTGAFICTRAVLPHMKRIGSGVVLNLSSVGGRRGAAGRGPYRASKAALINFTETIGAEGAKLWGEGGLPVPRWCRYRDDARDRHGAGKRTDEAGAGGRRGDVRSERRSGHAQRG